MIPEQVTTNLAHRYFGLGLLLVLFIVLGVWQALLIPFFQGPDEQVHYATVQYWAEPDEKTWPIHESTELNRSDDIRSYRFSEEIREAAYRLQFDEIKWQTTNTQIFVGNSPNGQFEQEITDNTWKRYIDDYPVNASGTWSLYYYFGSKMESFFVSSSILNRIFFSRLFSLFIGTLTVLVAYAAARKLGWGSRLSALFASLVAFQPMFIATSAIVNIDILLVFAFSLFFYGAINWLTGGTSSKSVCITLAAVGIGIFTKGPGVVLLALFPVLVAMVLYRHFQWDWRKHFLEGILALFTLTCLVFIFTPPHILSDFLRLESVSAFSGPIASLSAYAEKTLSISAFLWTTTTYWGSFGWLDARLSEGIIRIILAIETVAFFGLAWLLFDRNPPGFLPAKKVLLFAVLSIIFLQFAIRFFDWRVFDATSKILIGTPGRYFLPNIIPHLLLIATGIGYWAGTKTRFILVIKTLSFLIFLLSLYSSWFIILPRYYL